jgi:hypothetical protein
LVWPKRCTLLVAGSLAVYSAIGLAWIRLPGPYYDELLFVPAAMGAPAAAKLRVFHHDLPAMLSTYVGALKGWLWYFVFVVWKPTLYSARVPAVLLGGLALLFFYLWARRWYPTTTVLLALTLVAADPSYIFTARLDWGPAVLSHVLVWAGLLLGTVWYKRAHVKSARSLAAGHFLLGSAAFCFGLGLWDKAVFIWFLVALSLSLLLLFRNEFIGCFQTRALALFLACFLAGALPFLIVNLKTGRQGTATMVRLEPWDPTQLVIKLKNIKGTLVGESTYYLVTMGPDISPQDRNPSVVGTALASVGSLTEPLGNAFLWIFCLAATCAPFFRENRRAVLFPFVITALMWAQMIIAKGAGVSVHHYVLAYPFPQLGVAAVVGQIWESAKRWTRPAIVAAVAVVLVRELSWDARYLRMFRETGGRLLWTDAIYEIADFLQVQKPTQVAIMDWGFYNQLLLLTQGRVPMYEDWYAADAPRIVGLINEPNSLFLLHTKEVDPFPGGQKLLGEIAPQENAACRTVRGFFEREGRMVAILVRCAPLPGSKS